jgi:branched-chain amino acid transport system ATP-binding protein
MLDIANGASGFPARDTRSATGDDQPLIVANGLTVRYGALVALGGASFTLNRGEVLGIIGPNGAGKSSAFRALTNSCAKEGDVVFRGMSTKSKQPYELGPLGIKRTFQTNSFFADIDVLQNMVCALQRTHATRLLPSIFTPWKEATQASLAREHAKKVLRRFDIPEAYFSLLPTQIPYGTQRLLSIAMAYGDGAELLLLDEPAAGIGGSDMTALIASIRRLKQQSVTLIVIEHHMDVIMELADQILVLDQGRQIALGTPSEVKNHPKVRKAYLGDIVT